MKWYEKEEKKRKGTKWMDNWRKRLNIKSISIMSNVEFIEAYYFAGAVIDNMVRSYGYSANVKFDGCKVEDAKHLLASLTLFYLYMRNMPVEDCEYFKFNNPSIKTLASFIETSIVVKHVYDFEKEDYDSIIYKACPIYEYFNEIAETPFLEKFTSHDKKEVHNCYKDMGYDDVIKEFPNVHPFLYKSFMAYSMRKKEYNAELVRICVMALRKAECVIVCPKEYL